MASERVFDDYEIGESHTTVGRTVTHSDIRMWIGATDATHPNHVNSEYTADHPVFDDIVAPGVYTLSLADAFCAKTISRPATYGMNYGHDNVRYLQPVYVGDTISGAVTVADTESKNDTWGLLTLDVDLTNQDGESVLVEDHHMLIAKSASAVEGTDETTD
ncbi:MULTISPECIES: MaoC family dehydratase [Haloarcula]|uniref:MaoC family dehydratase n=1 Tax=Haloarcula TaxID=2237 RepID=UPI0023EB94CD|nr:MaoC/PaaZ C-terminal domain-containing protein [Halomicroarcula sp. XH51]